MKLVAFQGGAPATIAVLGGHAGILISTVPPIVQHIPAGKLRALAVTSPARSELLKDVPTMIESGFPGFRHHRRDGRIRAGGRRRRKRSSG